MKNIVDVAKRSKIRDVVMISAAGVTVPDHPLNRMGNVMTWKLKREDYLRASGLPYTILRPGGRKDTNAGLMGLTFRQGDKVLYNAKESVTSRGELAAICIAALDEPAARFKTLEVFNDPAAPPGNWRTEWAKSPVGVR